MSASRSPRRIQTRQWTEVVPALICTVAAAQALRAAA
jgi:hypothetical protein